MRDKAGSEPHPSENKLWTERCVLVSRGGEHNARLCFSAGAAFIKARRIPLGPAHFHTMTTSAAIGRNVGNTLNLCVSPPEQSKILQKALNLAMEKNCLRNTILW